MGRTVSGRCSSSFANDAYVLLVRRDAKVKSVEEARMPGGPPIILGSTAEGASRVFVGSAVVYTAEAKHRVLGVSRETLDGPGAVSRACARGC